MSEPGSTSGVVTIVVSDEQTDVDLDADRWADLASAVLQAEGRVGELTLTFVDRDEIAALNAEHMGEQGPTDVLSFPLDSFDDSAETMPGPVLLGDVVVCPAVASEAALTHADPRLCRIPRGRDAGIRKGLAQRMKRTRHKRTPSVRRRALVFIAAHPGCTEALLAAENIPADVLVELAQSGLVIARIERLDDEDGAVEVTCAWITATGERVLAARG